MKINQECHWSTTLATDLIARFASEKSEQINAQVTMLFTQLGEALDAGHTVVELSDEQWLFLSHSHPLVGVISNDDAPHPSKGRLGGGVQTNKPIIIQNQLAYLHRQWHQESTLADKIKTLLSDSSAASGQVDLNHLPDTMHERQRAAIEVALANRFTLITGGPGTGKTWTVAQLVLTLLRDNPQLNIALAAPTGKAAQRMQEALNKSLESSATPELMAVVNTQLDQAKTIHRLLGLGFNTAPRFHANKPLPYDLVIVDEASMLGVALANQLIQAIGENTKIILLGDANQLAAVDAGAVLADLCSSDALENNHVSLTKSTRFSADSGVGQLAQAVLANIPETASDIMNIHADIQHIKPHQSSIYTKLWQPFEAYATQLKGLYAKPLAEQQSQLMALFNAFDTYRILTATHAGKLGDNTINQHISQQLLTYLALTQPAGKNLWFHGRPVMMLSNDYQLKLANGDIGIALLENAGNFYVHFPSLDRPLAANRLSENGISTAFAMTIHKSQGSEFTKVAMVLDAPKADSLSANLLSRELIYTAITRAKHQVDIFSTLETFTHAIKTKSLRQTGLGYLLGK